MTMLHHLSLPVSDLAKSAPLYDSALGALGYRCVVSGDGYRGYGLDEGKDKLLLVEVADAHAASRGFHVAIAAPTTEAVDAFFAQAVEYGATDNGKPGYRTHYGDGYYAAFVVDPDGHHLEAVINHGAL